MAIIHNPAEDEDGNLAWPAKFTRDELDLRKDALGPLRYSQEYLCKAINLYGTILALEWLTYYDYDRALEDGELEGEYYFGVDPSITGEGDYMVISVLLKSSNPEMKKRFYLIDFVREKADLDRMVTLIERTAQIYPPRIINVEAVQAQQLLVQTLIDKTDLPVRGYQPKGKKEDRVAVMGNVYFSTKKTLVRGHRDEYKGIVPDARMTPFIEEWISFPRGRHDDTLDAVSVALDCAASSGLAASVASEGLIEEERQKRIDEGKPVIPERFRERRGLLYPR